MPKLERVDVPPEVEAKIRAALDAAREKTRPQREAILARADLESINDPVLRRSVERLIR